MRRRRAPRLGKGWTGVRAWDDSFEAVPLWTAHVSGECHASRVAVFAARAKYFAARTGLLPSRLVVFVIPGIEKRVAAASVLRGDGRLPAARVHPVNGSLVLFADHDALPSSAMGL